MKTCLLHHRKQELIAGAVDAIETHLHVVTQVICPSRIAMHQGAQPLAVIQRGSPKLSRGTKPSTNRSVNSIKNPCLLRVIMRASNSSPSRSAIKAIFFQSNNSLSASAARRSQSEVSRPRA